MVEHEDMAQGGLCTKEEMDEWSHFISYGILKNPPYREVVLGRALGGVKKFFFSDFFHT